MLPQQTLPLKPCCCRDVVHPSTTVERVGEISAGALSLGLWILMPKCPVCLAAQMALWTGLGLSFTTALYLRWSLLGVSGVALIYLLVKVVSRRNRHASPKPAESHNL